MKYLVVVDMQKDFIDGALGTAEAVAIVDEVAELAQSFDGEVIFTRDTHLQNYLETAEGKKLPVEHCIKDSDGWQLCAELTKFSEGAKIFDKPAFGSRELCEYIAGKGDAESITLCGLCTDICVISNAIMLKAYMPEVPVAVKESCCAGVTPESHSRALGAMQMCQIDII